MKTKVDVLLHPVLAFCARLYASRAALQAFVGARVAPRTVAPPLHDDAGLDAAWPAALRELAAVHRLEQARLLCQASALRRARAGERGPIDGRAPNVRAWLERCRAELCACRIDGVEAEYLVQECLRRPLARWRAASELASAALALGAGDEARIELAHARLIEGDARAAIEVLEALWPKTRNAALRASALETLAVACERSGDGLSALRHRQRAKAAATESLGSTQPS